jgi:hypothetical protein
MDQAAPDQAQPQGPDENQIIDQIGQLMQQLSPEKAKAVLDMLEQMIGGQPMPGKSDPNQGPNSEPVGM